MTPEVCFDPQLLASGPANSRQSSLFLPVDRPPAAAGGQPARAVTPVCNLQNSSGLHVSRFSPEFASPVTPLPERHPPALCSPLPPGSVRAAEPLPGSPSFSSSNAAYCFHERPDCGVQPENPPEPLRAGQRSVRRFPSQPPGAPIRPPGAPLLVPQTARNRIHRWLQFD